MLQPMYALALLLPANQALLPAEVGNARPLVGQERELAPLSSDPSLKRRVAVPDDRPLAPSPGDAGHGQAFATDDAARLAVPCIPQETQVWCWAATTEAVLRYGMQSPAPSQCRILSDFLDCDCCQLPLFCPFQCLVAAPSMSTIAQAVFFYSGVVPSLRGALDFAEVMGEIDAGRPIIMGYTGSFNGHVVVLYGYDLTMQTVDVCDPFFGDFQGVPFGSVFTYGGNLIWSHSITGLPAGDVDGTPAAGGSESSDECPLAGLVYVDGEHPDLRALRRFRDERLDRFALGDAMIRRYYASAPSLAHALRSSALLLHVTRAAMVPVMGFVHLALAAPRLALACLLLCLTLAIWVAGRCLRVSHRLLLSLRDRARHLPMSGGARLAGCL